MPLLQIARHAELGSLPGVTPDLQAVQVTADTALRLLDSYILGIQLASEEEHLFETEPVSVSSVLYDAGSQLLPLAKAYDVQLDLHIGGRYEPVMAHRRGLQSALVSLGYALIEALPAMEAPQLRLQLSAHRCRYGIVAGMYCNADQLGAQALRQGKSLYGQARQPLTDMTHTSGAGVFMADAILRGMRSQLTASRHQKLRGLGAILQPSAQMQLV